MTMAETFINDPSIPHGKIGIAFTSDEEVGRGADYFDIEGFGMDYAYTVDGGPIGELEYENFNAAEARVYFKGRDIHPGYAKDVLINAVRIATELERMLPQEQRPEYTDGYDGFFHMTQGMVAWSSPMLKNAAEYDLSLHSETSPTTVTRMPSSAPLAMCIACETESAAGASLAAGGSLGASSIPICLPSP